MKSVLLKILAFSLCLSMLLLASCGGDSKSDDSSSATSSKPSANKEDKVEENYDRIVVEHQSAPVARFLVISDTHNRNEKLIKAISSTWSYAQTQEYKGFDGVIVVGDLTDNGTDEELATFKSAFDSAVKATGQAIPLIACMGNHEFGNKEHSAEENATYVARFEKILGIKATDEYDINGVKILALSPSNHAGDYTKATDFAMAKFKTYGEEQQYFVLKHYQFLGTVYGSGDKGDASALYQATSKHTNAVVLTGHSHSPITNLRSVYQLKNGFSAYNCGSLTNTQALYSDVEGSGYYTSNQFSIFEVYSDNVTDVKLYDMNTDKFLDTTYQIGAKVNNTLEYLKKATDNPLFAEGKKVDITTIGTTAVQVSFPQGTDDDEIEKYRIEVVDKDGNVVANSYVTSYFFSSDRPATLTHSVSGLREKTEYTAQVIAVDFYGNESEPIKSEKFTTGSYPTGLTTVTEGKLYSNLAKWQGAITNVSNEKGYFISSQGSGHYLQMSEPVELGSTWMASVDYFRATYNLTEDFKSFSAMQIGPLTLGVKRGSTTDYLCVAYNYDATNANASAFDSGYVIAKAEISSTLGQTNTLTMTYEKGEIKVYRDGSLAIHLTADQVKSKCGTLPSFASSQVVLRLNDTWVVDKAGATFENFTLKK